MSEALVASTWGTPQRSRLTRTGPSSPPRTIVPFCLGSGRRAIQCQAAAVPAAASPAPAAPAISPARVRLIPQGYWPASQDEGLRGEAAFRLELVEMGLHDQSRRWADLVRHVVPDLGEQGVVGTLASFQGREQSALAHL